MIIRGQCLQRVNFKVIEEWTILKKELRKMFFALIIPCNKMHINLQFAQSV